MKLKLVRTPKDSLMPESDFPFLQIGCVYDIEPEDIDHYDTLCSDVVVRLSESDEDNCVLDLSCFEPVDDEAKVVFTHPNYKPGYMGV